MEYKYKEIGEILKKKRLELGRSLSSVSEETRVNERYLVAIEEGDIKEFQSHVYYSLFAHSYARELGIDDEELFEQEKESEPIPAPADAGAPKPPVDLRETDVGRKGTIWSWIWFPALLLIAAAVIVLILMKGESPSEGDVRGIDSSKTSSGEVQPDTSTPPAEAFLSDIPVAAPPPDTTLRLDILVKQACWFNIQADKDTVVFGSLNAGESRNLTARNSFIISAGNPAGVEFKLNDTLLKPLSPDGKPLRLLGITRNNYRSFYKIIEDSVAGRN